MKLILICSIALSVAHASSRRQRDRPHDDGYGDLYDDEYGYEDDPYMMRSSLRRTSAAVWPGQSGGAVGLGGSGRLVTHFFNPVTGASSQIPVNPILKEDAEKMARNPLRRAVRDGNGFGGGGSSGLQYERDPSILYGGVMSGASGGMPSNKYMTPSDEGNGKHLNPSKRQEPINAVFGKWQEFYFGPTGSLASPGFMVTSKTEPIRIRITDLYWVGDRFEVIVQDGVHEVKVMETPMVDSDSRARCMTDPRKAFKSNNLWSRGQAILPAGRYHIMIKAKSSPYAGGVGAILFEKGVNLGDVDLDMIQSLSESPVCPGAGGFSVVRQKVPPGEKAKACTLLGLAPVDLDWEAKQELDAVGKTLAKCMGKERAVWVNTYRDQDGKDWTEPGVVAFLSKSNRLHLEERDPKEQHQTLCKVVKRSL